MDSAKEANKPLGDLRRHPEKYRIGKGEQFVLSASSEPYKSEILPHWAFRTPEIARESSQKIYQLFLDYLEADDFVGADMARKFLQMGWTRSRRYANHKSGKKYIGPVPADKKGQSGAHGREIAPREEDAVKAESAEIFYQAYLKAKDNPKYKAMYAQWKEKYG